MKRRNWLIRLRVFRLSWKRVPQHLRMIYEVFDDNLVNEYLDGNLDVSEPWLYQGNFDV